MSLLVYASASSSRIANSTTMRARRLAKMLATAAAVMATSVPTSVPIAADRIAAQAQQPGHAAALFALAAAERRRSQVTPTWCVSYLQTWRIDAQAWVARIGALKKVDQFSSATAYLDLSGDLVGLNP
jgi:hypothetical protein